MSEDITTDDALYARVRALASQREPTLAWEQIADAVGFDSTDLLIAWFVTYRLPPPLVAVEHRREPTRNPDLAKELRRLRDREASLLTVCSQAPEELVRVQRRIESIGRTH